MQSINITFTAIDDAGLEEECVIRIVVRGKSDTDRCNRYQLTPY